MHPSMCITRGSDRNHKKQLKVSLKERGEKLGVRRRVYTTCIFSLLSFQARAMYYYYF